MSVSRSQPVTTMTTDQCWAAVSRMALGRLVTVIDDEPDIFPVNYVVQQRTILFRTAPGVKLLGVQRNPRVAFEVDDHTVGTGWSVIVRGEAGVVTGDEEVGWAERAQVLPWTTTAKDRFVRIRPSRIDGRLFTFGPLDAGLAEFPV